MKTSQAIATAVASFHLTLVGCGAAGVTWPPALGVAGRALACYGELSGANNGYGFYAPAVGTEQRAVVTITDEAGQAHTDVPAEGATHEARLRLGSIAGMLIQEGPGPRVAASWAAAMFGRHPGARQIVLRVEEYDVPTMAEYRAGTSPRWVPVYEANFSRTGGGRDRKEAVSR
jgi:hypothetical protein